MGHKIQMHIEHNDIVRFAESEVNLPKEHASKYRKQVSDLSDRLKAHINDNPDYNLKRMMLSGSLAKRTSLRSISDADAALYVKPDDDTPKDMTDFLAWLVKELATLYPNIKPEQISAKTYSVSISFRGTGLDVDVVPIYWQDSDWNGDLVSQDNGSLLRTNIPQHLEFISTRQERHSPNSPHFKQVIRLLKYWAGGHKEKNENFRFKSFMIELIMAHLADTRLATAKPLPLDNYPEALREFFDFLHMSNLDDVISFDDFGQGNVQVQDKPINIFDPVNSGNNVAEQYTQVNKELILEAALEAADAIEYASVATTKDEALRQWRKVLGSTFRV